METFLHIIVWSYRYEGIDNKRSIDNIYFRKLYSDMKNL